MTEPAIRLTGVGKQYTKYEDAPMLITAALRFRSRTKRSKLWAVRNVNLEAQPGECIGVIGRNGAGKSTMLQMLAGVTAPTEGRVEVRGRIAPLISVGVGFHPELTGRENVYVNGMILGLTRSEIDRRFDDIVEFSEIGDFIDTPVKFYSSGMFVRLGFGVAVQAEPDVLLVDEVLAVGDLAFQKKCFDRMAEVRTNGTTVAVVSHNLKSVSLMCDRTTVMHKGEQVYTGPTLDAINVLYDILGEERAEDGTGPVDPSGMRVMPDTAAVEAFALIDDQGRDTRNIHSSDDVRFRISVRFDKEVSDANLTLSIFAEGTQLIYSEPMEITADRPFRPGEHVTFDIATHMRVPTGSYLVSCGMFGNADNVRYTRAEPFMFFVNGRRRIGGLVDLEATCEVRSIESLDAPAP